MSKQLLSTAALCAALYVRAAGQPNPPAPEVQIFLETAETGEVREVPPQFFFRAGDRVRFCVTPAERGFLYVVLYGSTNEIRVLYPASDSVASTGPANIYEPQWIPDRRWFRFDDVGGVEVVYIVWASERVPSLDRAISHAAGVLAPSDFATMLEVADHRTARTSPATLRLRRIDLTHR